MEYLAKSDLSAPAIISVEKIAKVSKMVKLAVDLGDTKNTVVAVIIGEFTPEQLAEETVIPGVNLRPAKLMGIRFEGMVLAAFEQENGAVPVPDCFMAPGTHTKQDTSAHHGYFLQGQNH